MLPDAASPDAARCQMLADATNANTDANTTANTHANANANANFKNNTNTNTNTKCLTFCYSVESRWSSGYDPRFTSEWSLVRTQHEILFGQGGWRTELSEAVLAKTRRQHGRKRVNNAQPLYTTVKVVGVTDPGIMV